MVVAENSLLAHAFERAALIADKALIVTNQTHYFLTENLLKETPQAPKVSYLLEPQGRNTAPAIALAGAAYSKALVMTLFVLCWLLII